MSSIERSIEVNVPVTTAYNQWTQFEEFPRFLEGVEEVRQLDNKRLHWRAQVGGKEKEWDAEIVEQEPDRIVAWRSISGAENSGTVTFQPIDANTTQVTLNMGYEPEGFLENVGDMLGFVSGRVQGDLQRFKEYIESRGQESGAWRGEIHGGQAQQTGSAGSYQQTSGYQQTGQQSYSTQASTGSLQQGQEVALPVIEEELQVGKREVETGGVRVTSRVEEQPVNEQVTLREEHVNVEHRPVNRPASESDFRAVEQQGSLEVRERSEQAVVNKEARVVEEVVINKEVEQRTETVGGTVRRTDVDVQPTAGTTQTTGYAETGNASTGYSDTNTSWDQSGASSNLSERSIGSDIDDTSSGGTSNRGSNY